MNTLTPTVSGEFSYETLAPKEREFVVDAAIRVQVMLRRTSEDVVQIGDLLRQVKALLQGAQYESWLKTELGITTRTAENFIGVAVKFGDQVKKHLKNVQPSILYLLSSPSTPEAVVEQVTKTAKEGKTVTLAHTKKLIEEAKTQAAEEHRRAFALKEKELTAQIAQKEQQNLGLRTTNQELHGKLAKLGKEIDALEQKKKDEKHENKQLEQDIVERKRQVQQLMRDQRRLQDEIVKLSDDKKNLKDKLSQSRNDREDTKLKKEKLGTLRRDLETILKKWQACNLITYSEGMTGALRDEIKGLVKLLEDQLALVKKAL